MTTGPSNLSEHACVSSPTRSTSTGPKCSFCQTTRVESSTRNFATVREPRQCRGAVLATGDDAVKERLAAGGFQLTDGVHFEEVLGQRLEAALAVVDHHRLLLVCEQDLEKLIEASTIDSPVLIKEIDALDAKSGIPRQGLVRRVALDAQRIVGSRSQVLREPRRDQRFSDSTFCLNDAMKLTHGSLLSAEPKCEDGALIRAPAWEDFGGGCS